MTTFVNVTKDLTICADEVAYFYKYVHIDFDTDSDILKRVGGQEGHNTVIQFKNGSGLWTAATVKEVRDALAAGIRKLPSDLESRLCADHAEQWFCARQTVGDRCPLCLLKCSSMDSDHGECVYGEPEKLPSDPAPEISDAENKFLTQDDDLTKYKQWQHTCPSCDRCWSAPRPPELGEIVQCPNGHTHTPRDRCDQ